MRGLSLQMLKELSRKIRRLQPQNRREMWRRIVVLVCGVSACFWVCFSASGQTLQWHGLPTSWTAVSDSAHVLALTSPGSAWLYTCPPSASSLSARVRWSTSFSGSQNNYSSIHLFDLPVGTAPGDPSLATGPPPESSWTFHIGASGADDGLEITSPVGDETAHFQGELAGPVDLEVGWQWPPGDSILMLATSLAPVNVPLTPVDTLIVVAPAAGPPDCIGWAATVTSSNLQGVQFALESWQTWTPDTLPPVFLAAQLTAADTVVWTANEPLANNAFSHLLQQPLPIPATPGVPVWVSNPVMVDLAGNVLASGTDSVELVWTDPSLHGPGRVVFSEICADPTPSDWLPEAEWVEVVNVSSLAVQTADLQWFDATSGPSSIEPLPPWDGVLRPGERALLSTSDETLFPGTPQAHLPNGGSLSDYGDEIGLMLPSGHGDSLKWSDRVAWNNEDWDGNGRNGRSWQRRYLNGCAGPANWHASSASQGATPGTSGWLENDGPGPDVPATWLTLPRTPVEVDVETNVSLDPWSIQQLPPGVTGHISGPESKHLNLVREAVPAATAPAVKGLQRCFGMGRAVNWDWPDVTLPFARPGDLLITEILAEPAAGSPGAPAEWIELHNLRADSVELTGLSINGHVPSQRWFVGPDQRVTFPFPGPHDLPNISGPVAVNTHSGESIDSVHYNPCFFSRKSHVGKGRSMVRTAAGWATSGAVAGASPEAVDPAETIAMSATDGPLEWVLCGRTSSGNQAVVLFNRAVTEVNRGTIPWPLPGWPEGRVWAIDWPVEEIPWPGLVIPLNGEDSVRLEPPEGCGLQMTEHVDIRLTEVLADTDVEPFVEVRAHGGSIASGSLALSAADDPMDPANRFPMTSDGISWFLPAESPWAFANCPSRLKTPKALPFSDMPSLWGHPQVSLLQASDGDWSLADSVALGDGRHADWVRDTREISLERCGDNSWTSCRNAAGHTASDMNSTEGWCDEGGMTTGQAVLNSQVWWPGGAPLVLSWCRESVSCTPVASICDAWSLREIEDLGAPVPGPENCMIWAWEGGTHYGSGVPASGEYFVRLSGCPNQPALKQWFPFVIRSP